jgi:hypothetical protein
MAMVEQQAEILHEKFCSERQVTWCDVEGTRLEAAATRRVVEAHRCDVGATGRNLEATSRGFETYLSTVEVVP